MGKRLSLMLALKNLVKKFLNRNNAPLPLVPPPPVWEGEVVRTWFSRFPGLPPSRPSPKWGKEQVKIL